MLKRLVELRRMLFKEVLKTSDAWAMISCSKRTAKS